MSDQRLFAEQVEVERVGILGGTFDPIHYAHLATAEEVYHALKLSRILFVPAGQPPHKVGQNIAPAHQRLAMLKLAIASNEHFTLSLVDMQRTGPSYTFETLHLLRQELGPRTELYFVIGSDSLKDLPTWYKPESVIAQATIVAITRPGYPEVSAMREQLVERLPGLEQRLITLEGPRLDISSTELRKRVAQGYPIKYQVPESVEDYIFRQKLYQNAGSLQNQEQEDTHATNTI